MPTLVPLPTALAALGGISAKTFSRRWQSVFTPRRADGSQAGRGSPRVVLSDELEAAVAGGPGAVEILRRSMGRC
jgi:hypothetical protein